MALTPEVGELAEDFILKVDRSYRSFGLNLSDSVLLSSFMPKVGRGAFAQHLRGKADLMGLSLTWGAVVKAAANWIREGRRSYSANLW